MVTGRRILLVDDQPEFLAVLRRVVEDVYSDVTVVYAAEVGTAEWQLESTSISFVLTDLRMTGDPRAGIRVLEAARKASVPAALITAAAGEELDELLLLPELVIQKTGDVRQQLRAALLATFGP